MGALTFKSFPFELRGWEIEKLESIDPTDGFGSNTRVYISKNQVVQIEPDYNSNTYNTWLTDKGRQFFDGIFGIWDSSSNESKNKSVWTNILKSLIQSTYMSEHCYTKQKYSNCLTIIFENLSLELLSLLNLIAERQSYLKIKRAENLTLNNDLESNFQLNSALNKIKLSTSTLCLLISNNPRFEGYFLNLSLRQRYLKGDFKCFVIGSFINLTFSTSFLGSNLNVLKSIMEGNNFVCQELKLSKNPIIIYNCELLKRNDGKNSLELLKLLKYTNIFNNSWNGLNILSPSLTEVGIQSLNKFLPFNEKDLQSFNSFYFINVSLNNINNLKKITDLKLLNFKNISNKEYKNSNLFIDQNSYVNNNMDFFNSYKKLKKYFYLPSSSFYENEETFINTEGFVKRTNKIIFKKQTKNNWQILRKILKHIYLNFIFLNNKNNNLIFFNSKKIINFKNYINLHYQATQTLTNINCYLNIKNENFIFVNKNYCSFKNKQVKLHFTKLKYWLDDFFNGGKDEFSHKSLILSNCSKILHLKSTNFF